MLQSPEIARYVYDAIGNLDRIVHSNGVVSDYVYNAMNRLIMLTHYAPDGTPETLDDNPVLQRYEYSYYDNGHKSGETFTDANGNVHTWDWLYDELGRLTRETHDNADDLLDYATEYVYDLVGNRLEKRTDTDGDNVFDEVVKSNYDRNDRLLNELKIVNNVSSQQTTYSYAGTDQTGKTGWDLLNSRIESTTSMEYNAQGRMSKITIVSYVDGVLSKTVVQEYAYDSSGIKVTQRETVYDASNAVESTKETTYLNDKQNHTGYSQVLEEKTEEGGQTKTTTYTIGHDVLSQHDAVNGLLTLLSDGHGSTRAVANMLGQILQQYSYDAYGNAVGFNASEALTNLLYSGEQFNPVSGLQYLRARWYNPQTGTFNRLDPFSGNRESPLSFHKYAYANMNPVMMIDPSGAVSVWIYIALAAVTTYMLYDYIVGPNTWYNYNYEMNIQRFQSINMLIRRLGQIGNSIEIAYIANPNPANAYFRRDWQDIGRASIDYQQQYYSDPSKWFLSPLNSSLEFSPRITSRLLISFNRFYSPNPLDAIETMLHEALHDGSMMGIGHYQNNIFWPGQLRSVLDGVRYVLEQRPFDFPGIENLPSRSELLTECGL